MSRIEEELEKTINWLQKEIDRSSRDEPGKQEMHRELEKKQRELEQIIEHKTKGAILRSKCRWYNEGEKNTKYFLILEKRHYKNGVISHTLPESDIELLYSSNFPAGFIQPITDFVSKNLIPSKASQLTLRIYILQAPRAQKIKLSCLFGITRDVPTRKIEYFLTCNKSFSDQVCSFRISTLFRSIKIHEDP